MNRSLCLALALLATAPITSILSAEAYRADHPAVSARIHEQAAYSRQDTAALDALIARPDDILERGRRNATAPAGRHYTQKEAAIRIARLWNIEVKP